MCTWFVRRLSALEWGTGDQPEGFYRNLENSVEIQPSKNACALSNSISKSTRKNTTECVVSEGQRTGSLTTF